MMVPINTDAKFKLAQQRDNEVTYIMGCIYQISLNEEFHIPKVYITTCQTVESGLFYFQWTAKIYCTIIFDVIESYYIRSVYNGKYQFEELNSFQDIFKEMKVENSVLTITNTVGSLQWKTSWESIGLIVFEIDFKGCLGDESRECSQLIIVSHSSESSCV